MNVVQRLDRLDARFGAGRGQREPRWLLVLAVVLLLAFYGTLFVLLGWSALPGFAGPVVYGAFWWKRRRKAKAERTVE